jgi:long-chain acyl-CoA synthetase
VNRRPSPPDLVEPVPLDASSDPVAAVLEAYRTGRSISVLTSGTTSPPRRIVRTARSWVDSFPLVADLAAVGPDSRAWVPGPLTATMNLYAAALVAHLGAARVRSVAEATHAFLTPAALIGLLAEPGRAPGLHLIMAGDRLPVALADRAEARSWTVHHYYGAAQLSFVAWGRDETSLRPFPRTRVQARHGELWVSSPWLCERELGPGGAPPTLRTWRDPDAGEIWATVGDRGRIAENGCVLVAGRDGVIVTGGATVLVGDVEAVLRPPARGDVYVIGQPHDRLGAVVVAVCTDRADLDALPRFARLSLQGAARPRRWLHCPELPLTAAGKVDRATLATWVNEAGQTGSHARVPRLLPG